MVAALGRRCPGFRLRLNPGYASAIPAAAGLAILLLVLHLGVLGIDDLLVVLAAFAAVRGRLFVNCATVSPGYSSGLEQELRAAGARFVEAPVSGSRKPAEAAKRGGADAVSLINTVNSLMGVDLETMLPTPSTDATPIR